MTSPRISVVICAYTEIRWSQTCAAVDSVRTQSVPSTEIILVVDHNPALHKRFTAALPDVKVVENSEEPGLSGARNTGVALTNGDIVAFLDDDAAAEPDWLKFIGDSYVDPAVIGAGGLTLPRWETHRPRWMPAEFYWVVGCNYLGMPSSRAPVRNLLGGNMSFRRDAFDLVDGFRTGIGRTARKRRPLGCEETEFCIRLSQSSPKSLLLIENRAVVWHMVPRSRGRFSYFASRCFAEGLSKAVVAASVGSGTGLSAERHYATKTLPRGMGQGVIDLLRGDPWGLARAGAIAFGLTVTATGYVAGSANKRARAGGFASLQSGTRVGRRAQ